MRAERDELRRIEDAKIAAEREAWLRVEAASAAERARHAIALEEHRIAQELELRRAEVAKTRPTWMLRCHGARHCCRHRTRVVRDRCRARQADRF